MKVDIGPATEGANVIEETQFHFCCFGNYSGLQTERPELVPLPVNRNNWDSLFEQFHPSVTVVVALAGVSDFELTIPIRSLADFSRKGLANNVPVLASLSAFRDKVGKANEESPLDVAGELAGDKYLKALKAMADSYQEAPALDLLNMVDLGSEEESDEPTLVLKRVKSMFQSGRYDGQKRQAAVREIQSVIDEVVKQIEASAAFNDLEAEWRGLKMLLGYTDKNTNLFVVDCMKSELCDATFLIYVKPQDGVARRLDLAMCTFSFEKNEADLHVLYHIGRMAETLSIPFLMNVDPGLFGVKSLRHLQHLQDISGRVAGPEFAKWRKQRDESGSQWLFMCVNEVDLSGGVGDRQVWCPASLAVGAIILGIVAEGEMPGELLGPQGELDLAGGSHAGFDENQGYDYSYQGMCALTSSEAKDRVQLLGMNCFAAVKVGMGETPSARDFVEYTLSYRFFVGCALRFILEHAASDDLRAEVMRFLGTDKEEDVVLEEEEGQTIFRMLPRHTIFGNRPDVVLGIDGLSD